MYFVSAEFIIYDDACHLRKYSRNPVRTTLTKETEQLASTEMVVDKMHMRGHTDKWCSDNCDASKFKSLNKVKCCTFFLLLCIYTYFYIG